LEQIEKQIEQWGLKPHRICSTLSGGERQRVRLAQVFAHCGTCPDLTLVLLDEPLQSLDISFQKRVFDQMERWAERALVLVALHDLYPACPSRRTLLINNGTLVADEHRSPEEKLREVFQISQGFLSCDVRNVGIGSSNDDPMA
jgi:ABC-type hemin transport system ATPase subunit